MNIAIQGHPTRGKEVIQILESLGGNNLYMMTGSRFSCYYINSYYSIDGNSLEFIKKLGYTIYTLEEFEKEFPFKIGDKIRDHSDNEIGTILGFVNIDDELMYVVDFEKSGHANMPAEELKHYKEMERNITLTLDKAKEWYKKGGELKEVALQAYSEEELTKVELPKTWEEFCDNYMIDNSEAYFDTCGEVYIADKTCRHPLYDRNMCPSKKSAEAHLAMIQLEQLRDCYRGLFVTVIGMPVWCIVRYKGELIISKRTWGTNETFLSFQSPETAEKYLKNFKPLIKQAEDLI